MTEIGQGCVPPASFAAGHPRRAFIAVAAIASLLCALSLLPGGGISGLELLRGESDFARVVLEYRCWRLLLGVGVGAGLAVAGLIMQGVLRNPLADPYILGLSAGGGLGVAIGIVLGAAAPWVLPLAGFAGALASLAVVLLLSRAARGSGSTLLLAGVAWSALCSSLLMLAVNRWEGTGLHNVFWWFLGDLQVNESFIVLVVSGLVATGLVVATLLSRAITILAMGDELTALLGLNPERLRYLLLAVATLLAGSCVAAAGVIGFVGLVAPHVARRLVGSGHRWLVPATAFIGAAWVTSADALGRAIAYPHEWPVGVVCALAGAPFFLALLRRGAGASWK